MRQLPPENDVVIIGAGPTGLTLAADLQRRGVTALILDRLLEGENTSRAAVVHAHTLEVLEPLGVTQTLVREGLKVPIFRVRDRDATLLTLDFKEIQSAYPFALMCPQNRTETILLDRLRVLGGDVFRPAEVKDVGLSSTGAHITVAAGGIVQTIQTAWLIGCDGMHSRVRDACGIQFSGSAYEQTFILADVHMEWPISRDEVALFFSANGLVVVAPLPGDRFRVVATVDNPPANPSIDDVQAILDTRGPQKSRALVQECVWASRFRVHHRLTESPRKGRVLLCGDAAHVHSPAGGQGMNTGIQDSMSLAEVFTEVLRGAPDNRLNEWAAKRHEIAEGVVTLTDRMTRVATLHSATARSLRNAAIVLAGHLPFLTGSLARTIAELDND